MTVILGPDFRRDRSLPLAKLADVQPQPPHTRVPIGRTPWRVVPGHANQVAAILDRDNNTITATISLPAAHQTVTAVNAYVPLNAQCADLIDILRAAQAELRMGSAEDAVMRVAELLDNALTPSR